VNFALGEKETRVHVIKMMTIHIPVRVRGYCVVVIQLLVIKIY